MSHNALEKIGKTCGIGRQVPLCEPKLSGFMPLKTQAETLNGTQPQATLSNDTAVMFVVFQCSLLASLLTTYTRVWIYRPKRQQIVT